MEARAARFLLVAIAIATFVALLRTIAAAVIPLSGDEAYYWEWSRRLAGGYVDHPPAVAWTIAACTFLGRTAFAVRAGFVLYGLGATLFAGATAYVITKKSRAAGHAMLMVALAPMVIVSFAMASPDAPYALAWSASLYFAARALREARSRWYVLLGLALGAALLSRFFSWALAAGIVAAAIAGRYPRALRGLTLSFCVAGLLFAPFLWWNATHHWATFVFSLAQRHTDEWNLLRPFVLFIVTALAFSPLFWLAAVRSAWQRIDPLLFWTGAPLLVIFFVLAAYERVEVYWFVGPFISLAIAAACVTTGIATARYAVAGALCLLLFLAAFAPAPLYALAHRAGLRLADGGPFELYTYEPLAHRMLRYEQGDAAIMTDGYGFSSLLDFYADIPPVVIGYDAQGSQARQWVRTLPLAANALFVDKVPFRTREDFERRFAIACTSVVPGPTLAFPLPGSSVRRYYATWCDGIRPDTLALLRWERRSPARTRQVGQTGTIPHG
jgi:4-amino-4-deoxy-L-arabinose transferase-like glycosyltransferase